MYHLLIDYNRAGTTLMESVTEPVIKTGEEAGLFVSEVRKLVRYLYVFDGNMEEGSLRCDANISVMLKGSDTFGIKVAAKNMSSISNVRKAIEYEKTRKSKRKEDGKELVQEIKEHHFDVYGWTVDEPERILELIEMGIDGVITNDPRTLARIIKRYQALSPAQRSLVSFRRFWKVFIKLGLWNPQPPGEAAKI